MSRRIFLQSDSFAAASNIFTKVIWKKETQKKYRNKGIGIGEDTRLFYTLFVYQSAIKNPSRSAEKEKNLVLTVELTEALDASRIKSRSAFTYKIATSVVIKKEKILVEEINTYLVTAKLVSQEGDFKLPPQMENELTFTIKPELSATLNAENEIYLPVCEITDYEEGI